jgi:ribokinase
MTRAEIAIFGSINMDLVSEVERFPLPGETITARSFGRFPGGKGANQAVAAARLGGRVAMFGMVGDDPFAEELLNSLKLSGVEVDQVRRLQGISSGIALILVDKHGENMITINAGANGLIDRAYVEEVLPTISKARVLLLQMEVPPEAISQLLEGLPRENPLVILDPAPTRNIPRLTNLERVDILTPNLTELASLTGLDVQSEDRLKRALSRLVRGAHLRQIVCKAGAQGAYLMDERGQFVHFPAFKVEVIDTTAAGDAFNGGLGVALARGMELERAVVYANAAGALAVTRKGAQPAMPTAVEVEQLLERSGYEERWHPE